MSVNLHAAPETAKRKYPFRSPLRTVSGLINAFMTFKEEQEPHSPPEKAPGTEHRKIIRFAFTVGGFTMLSRLLGMLRDIFTAGVFGTSAVYSAFVIAFQVPNLFRALFGEGALSSAFVPVYMQTRREEGETAAWRLARRILTLAAAILLGLTALAAGGMSLALKWPGLGEKTISILLLGRIMFPYVLFICLAALCMAILNAHKQFSIAAFTPALLNITWILAILFIIPRLQGGVTAQIRALAWTVFIAGAVQLIYQLPGLWKVGWRPGLDFHWRDPRVTRVLLLMGPAALGVALNQINVLLSSSIAMWAGAWAPATLFYATRLIYLPQGMLAVSLSTVLLPVLSDAAARGEKHEMAAAIHHGLRTLLFVMTPAAIGLLVLAHPIVQMLLERGMFGAESTLLTARALRVFAPGLLVFCLAKVFVPAFYALQDTRTPIRIGMFCVGITLLCNILFVLTLPEYWRHVGLAASTVISECVNALLLARILQRRIGGFNLPGVLRGFLRALCAATGMAAAAWLAHRLLGGVLPLWTWLPGALTPWIAVPCAIFIGAGVYFAIARIGRYPELDFVLDALHAKRQRKTAA